MCQLNEPMQPMMTPPADNSDEEIQERKRKANQQQGWLVFTVAVPCLILTALNLYCKVTNGGCIGFCLQESVMCGAYLVGIARVLNSVGLLCLGIAFLRPKGIGRTAAWIAIGLAMACLSVNLYVGSWILQVPTHVNRG